MRGTDEVTAEIKRLMYVRHDIQPGNPDLQCIDAMIRVLATDMGEEDIYLTYESEFVKVCAKTALAWKMNKEWADSPSVDWVEHKIKVA